MIKQFFSKISLALAPCALVLSLGQVLQAQQDTTPLGGEIRRYKSTSSPPPAARFRSIGQGSQVDRFTSPSPISTEGNSTGFSPSRFTQSSQIGSDIRQTAFMQGGISIPPPPSGGGSAGANVFEAPLQPLGAGPSAPGPSAPGPSAPGPALPNAGAPGSSNPSPNNLRSPNPPSLQNIPGTSATGANGALPPGAGYSVAPLSNPNLSGAPLTPVPMNANPVNPAPLSPSGLGNRGVLASPGAASDLTPIPVPQLNPNWATVDNSALVSPSSGYRAQFWGCGPVVPAGAAPYGYPQTVVPATVMPGTPAAGNLYAGSVGPKPLFTLGQERNNISLGQGIIGQPVAYVPGQYFRNFLRYLSP